MKDRTFDDNQLVATADMTSQRSCANVESTGRRNDWTNSDWLSDWLKLARQRRNAN